MIEEDTSDHAYWHGCVYVRTRAHTQVCAHLCMWGVYAHTLMHTIIINLVLVLVFWRQGSPVSP